MMKSKKLIIATAAIGLLAACGKNNDTNNPNQNAQNTHLWQNVQATADCSQVPANALCQNGQTKVVFNFDGSYAFGANGQVKGTMSAEDLARLATATDQVVSQDAVQQTACIDSTTVIRISNSVSVAMNGNPSAPVKVYQESANTDQICARGDINRLQSLRNLMAELAAKYLAASGQLPPPMPTPTPSPTPLGTPVPAPSPTPMH